jgi:23S rRNA A1618 N6-methylase RlmF
VNSSRAIPALVCSGLVLSELEDSTRNKLLINMLAFRHNRPWKGAIAMAKSGDWCALRMDEVPFTEDAASDDLRRVVVVAVVDHLLCCVTVCQQMHPRNPYASTQGKVDFERLFKLHPKLLAYETRKGFFDVSLPGATEELVRAMFVHDLHLNWVGVPPGYLVPSVTRSLNYVLFVQDLVRATTNSTDRIVGIDYGTGASAVFAILGCALDAQWDFVACDVDATSLEWAARNISACGMQHRVQLVQCQPGRPDLLSVLSAKTSFVMCNPPFFASFDKTAAADSVFQGQASERAFGNDGGEVDFVTALIEDSSKYLGRCWFTSMVGMKASLKPLTVLLKARGATVYGDVALEQGKKRRWALCWAFASRMPIMEWMFPPCSALDVQVANLEEEETLEQRVENAIADLRVITSSTKTPTSLHVEAASFAFDVRVALLKPSVDIIVSNRVGMDSIKVSQGVVNQLIKDVQRTNRAWKRRRAASSKQEEQQHKNN